MDQSNQVERPKLLRVSISDPLCVERLANGVADLVTECRRETAVLLCIGSDRSTGDSLGPLVGSNMSKRPIAGLYVLGTLDNPVHAGNLCEALERLNSTRPDSLVIAVDASLGKLEQVGTVSLGRGALKPGAGVNKELPLVGHMFLTGTVNVGGFMEYMVLQNTRLSTVMKMAEAISAALYLGLTRSAAKPEGRFWLAGKA
ncbi:MAG: spore protease YyaC [Bacillota bacterium]